MSHMKKLALLVALAAALMLCLTGLAAAEDIHTTDHVWGELTFKTGATCSSPAVYEQECTICHATRTVTSGPLDPTNHQWSAWYTVTPAECEKNGLRRRECSLCHTTQEESIDALKHDWSGEWTVTKPATCTEDGVETIVCKNDVHHTKTRVIPKLGHNYKGTVTTEPTCTAPGVMTYVCQNDPAHSYTEAIPAAGHKWDSGKDDPAPTCTTPGKKIYTCTVCGLTREEPLPALGHKWDSGTVTKQPTCTEPGTRLFTCQNDPSHTKEEPIPATDHKWDSGTVTKKPTCTEPGSRHFVCQNDPSHTKDEVIPATGHQHTHWVVTKEPTYTEEGERKQYCDDCGALLKTEKMSIKMYYNNTVCAIGPRLRDVNLSPYNSDQWYMFTPFDASKDGRQTYTLIGSNRFDVGTLTIDVRNGQVTVNYKVYNEVDITLEFFTILNQMSDLHEYEPEALSRLSMVPGRAYSIEDDFGGDTNLVLYFCSRADYSIRRIQSANLGTPYRNLCRTMLNMMDK